MFKRRPPQAGPTVPMGTLRGYPRLARLMGTYPETAIFRRFGSLTMLNLMRLQAELLNIEYELEILQAQEDASSNPDLQSYSVDFSKLNASIASGSNRLALIDKSRLLLEQYRELQLESRTNGTEL
jgi:hypothetical protein